MKKTLKTALIVLSLLFLLILASCNKIGNGEVTTVDGDALTPTPQEITVEWENGFVGSFDNFGDGETLSSLSNSGSFVEDGSYKTTKPIKLEGKQITLSFSFSGDMTEENVFVISHWKQNADGSFSIDRSAPHFKDCSYIKADNGVYRYTASGENEIIRLSLKTDTPVKIEACAASNTPTLASFENLYTLPENGSGTLTDIVFSKGAVGGTNNKRGYKLLLDYSDEGFLTSQNILVPKKGTTIKYTVTGDYTYEVATLTSWFISDDGICRLNTGSSNYNAILSGKDGIQSVSVKTHTFEYTTSFDNEIIRLCVPSGNASVSVEYSVDEKFFKGTFDRLHTESISKAEYLKDVSWLPGYVTSPFEKSDKKGLITLSTVNDSLNIKQSEVLEKYSVSAPIHLEKKGTQVIIMVNDPARDSISVLSSLGEDKFTVDYTKPTFIGNPSDENTVFETYNEKSNMSVYRYISSSDDEYIRFTIKTTRTSYVPVVMIREMGEAVMGTWENVSADYDEQYREKIENMKGQTSEHLEKIDLSWNNGYVSKSGSVITTTAGYLYSDLIHLEKKGSVLYFMDSAKVGSDLVTYVGNEGLIFSFWNESGSRISSRKGIEGKDVDSYVTSDGNFRIFRYTSREDNEYIRLSLNASQSSPNVPAIICPVYIAENIALATEGEEEIKLTVSGKEVVCKITTPTSYTSDNYYSLLLTDNENSYNNAKIASLPKTVCVYTNAEASALEEIYTYLTLLYPINGEKTYYIGSSDALSKYTTASLAPDKANADSIKALVSIQSEGNYYADILEGLTMYAMGDSYFQGAGLGHYFTWPSMLARKYNMTHINYGIGGSTLANVSTNNPMVIRYTSMASGDADIILLEGGRNDRNQKVPYGSFDSRDITTLYGALNVIIDGLHNKYPSALIILVTPWNHKDNSEYVTYNYAMKMVEYQKQLNLDYVSIINAADVSISGVDMNDAEFVKEFSRTPTDISHLNSKGMTNLAPRMEKQVALLYAKFKGITIDENGGVK